MTEGPRVFVTLTPFLARMEEREDFERMTRQYRVSVPPISCEVSIPFEEYGLRIPEGRGMREYLAYRLARELSAEIGVRLEMQLAMLIVGRCDPPGAVPTPVGGGSRELFDAWRRYYVEAPMPIIVEPPTTVCLDCPAVVPVTEIWTGKRSGDALCEACVDRRVAGGRARKLTEEEAAAKAAGDF